MYIVQIFLPLYDNTGSSIPASRFERVAAELNERFGGLTTYTHEPAEGLWRRSGRTKRDHIVVYEVMSTRLERSWWKKKRLQLQRLFKQEELVIRAHPVIRL